MGSANVAVNSWLSDRERFADLFNGTLFDGKQLIHPERVGKQEDCSVIAILQNGGRVDLISWCLHVSRRQKFIMQCR